MSSWNRIAELFVKNLELAKKEEKTLKTLYVTGKISQSAYQQLEKKLQETLIKAS